MVMAFLLLVAVGEQPQDTQGMYFRDITRCNYFAQEIEKGNLIRSGSYLYRTERIDAYCLPRMVDKDTRFWD
jgi:hypothetical protein